MKLTRQASDAFKRMRASFQKFVPQAGRFVKKHYLPLCGCAVVLVAAIILTAVFANKDKNHEETVPVDEHIAVIAPTAEPDCTAQPLFTPEPTQRAANPNMPEKTIAPLHFHYGVTHSLVEKIQLRLMDLNYMDYDEPTSYYGDYTTEAVKLFQRCNGLDITGQIYEPEYDLLMSHEVKQYMASLGDEGQDVRAIQERLYEYDYIDQVTGFFGDVTEEAVKTFQEKNHLTVDGKVGPATKEALYSEEAVPFSLYLGSEGEDVMQFQNRLHELGYLTTEPDGKYGKDTVDAVKQFQELNGLISDGYLGPTTKQLLNSSDAKGNRVENGMSGNLVMKIQMRLYALKYLKYSSVTGYFGDTTEKAVKLFQKNNKLTQDGAVGRATMNRLFSANAIKSSAPVSGGGSGGGSGSGSGGSGGGGGSSNPGNPGSGTGTGVERLISVARSKLGCPYVRGAKGPNAFDCSGYVYWCLNHSGVSIGYMTSYAWRTTTRFHRLNSMSQIRRGDVIVYKMGATQGHVAIAAGSGMMYDASSRNGRVVYRTYNTAYWHNHFYCAYRIFGG